MSKSVVYVGMDVHKDSITIAVAHEGRKSAEKWKTIPYDGIRLRKALKMLVTNDQVLKVCYEAGPTGVGKSLSASCVQSSSSRRTGPSRPEATSGESFVK